MGAGLADVLGFKREFPVGQRRARSHRGKSFGQVVVASVGQSVVGAASGWPRKS